MFICDYVQQYGQKPVITLNPDNEALDLISLYGGLEPYVGPDPSVCNECTEVASPGPGAPRYCAPRSAFPDGPLGDFLYKVDKALAQSALFPGIGALRAPQAVFTAARFRASLIALRGNPSVISDAHHMLPQKFIPKFAQKGINVHDPRFGVWWEASAHRQAAFAYNAEWGKFFIDHPNASMTETVQFAKDLMASYGFNIFWL